jgi:hypothetical protein
MVELMMEKGTGKEGDVKGKKKNSATRKRKRKGKIEIPSGGTLEGFSCPEVNKVLR